MVPECFHVMKILHQTFQNPETAQDIAHSYYSKLAIVFHRKWFYTKQPWENKPTSELNHIPRFLSSMTIYDPPALHTPAPISLKLYRHTKPQLMEGSLKSDVKDFYLKICPGFSSFHIILNLVIFFLRGWSNRLEQPQLLLSINQNSYLANSKAFAVFFIFSKFVCLSAHTSAMSSNL
jgi:hypothetical protein